MHELGIMYHVVKQVLSVVDQHQLQEVEAIVLQVGELGSVIPRYLEACFPAAVDGTILENTKLEIEVILANGICQQCDKVFELTANEGICPECGSKNYETLNGREFLLKEIRAY
ncbi:hydrogenase nickel incorporation protein HypA/HybF [Clostridiales Family XIII bacterium PM5-7]